MRKVLGIMILFLAFGHAYSQILETSGASDYLSRALTMLPQQVLDSTQVIYIFGSHDLIVEDSIASEFKQLKGVLYVQEIDNAILKEYQGIELKALLAYPTKDHILLYVGGIKSDNDVQPRKESIPGITYWKDDASSGWKCTWEKGFTIHKID